jgi:BolA protein
MGAAANDPNIVSDLFTDHPLIARHRMIHDALGDLMDGEIHALAIRAQTALEANQLT